VLVNLAFRQSYLALQNGDGAVLAFIAFLRHLLRRHLDRLPAAPRRPPRGV
jgi:hypothetical protein